MKEELIISCFINETVKLANQKDKLNYFRVKVLKEKFMILLVRFIYKTHNTSILKIVHDIVVKYHSGRTHTP